MNEEVKDKLEDCHTDSELLTQFHKNTPQLRFSGFDDDWEEKKLNEYLEPSKQKNLDNKYSKNDVLSVSGEFGIVNQIEFQGRSFAGEYVNNYGVVETKDIVYTKSPLNANPYGIIKSNFGKTGIVSTLYAVYKSKNNVDPCFIQTYFDLNKRLNDYLRPLVRKGAKNDMKVSSEDALLGNVVFPSKLEQQKIGTFLSHVDSLIQAKTKKLENLKSVKKSLLQKCFPKEGEKVPEMRFAGFSGDWEEMKLGEVCEINPSSNLPSVFEYVDLESVLGSEMISHRTEFKNNAPSRAQRLAKKGDVFYQTVRPYQKNNYLFELDFTNYVFSTGYAQLRPKEINSKFLMCQIQSDTFVNMVLEKCTGTSYPAINSTELSGISLLVSNDFIEQQKIGQFFSKYDSLISAQQKEIDKLKDIKKSLLQKMFV